MSKRGDNRKLLAQAKRQGWRIEGGGSKHYRLYAPNGEGMYVIPSSHSDWRGERNARTALKRMGLNPSKRKAKA